MTAAFDTLAAARAIEASGLQRPQAEAIADAIRAAQGELATRADLQTTTSELRADLQTTTSELRADLAELRTEFANLRADIYRALWVQGAGLAAVFGGLIAAASALGVL